MLSCSGLFGFFYIDIGSSLRFTYTKKSTESEETETITDSKTLKEYMRKFTDPVEKLKWNKRTIFRHDKYLLLGIAATYIHELNSSKEDEANIFDTIEDLIKSKDLPVNLL